MLPGQMLPGKMSLWQSASLKDGPRILPLKFGQNWVSNSWDIPDMDKCCQDNCCEDKCYCDSWNMFKSQEPTLKVWSKSGQEWLRYSWYGQMSPWQMLPGQMSLWQLESVQDSPRNLSLKFGQNRVSNSWDIPDMDKCHPDKCCLDKCHCDS